MDYKYIIEDLEADVKDLRANKAGYGYLMLLAMLIAVGFGLVFERIKRLESRLPVPASERK